MPRIAPSSRPVIAVMGGVAAVAGVLEGHPSVGGFITPLDGTYFHHVFPVDLVLGARTDTDQGIVDYFDGMLDEVRITAGQVPEDALLAPDISTAVEEGGKAALPDAAEPGQSFPNPFNSTAKIQYVIAAPTAAASLTIYDLLGQRVRELMSAGPLSAGRYQVVWDGRDDDGQLVGNGVYLYQLRTDALRKVRKMVLIK